ncbi:MAG: NAD(P)/FAD-dependent oxidoreductase [Rhodothermales bacterium]
MTPEPQTPNPEPQPHDAIIVGAGPGGATAAAFLAEQGRRVLLLDKSTFPRDKVCGDAISGKSVDVLRRLGLVDRVMQTKQVGSWGVTFGGPYGDEVAIPFTKELDKPVPPGFVCAREVFDQVLFEKAVQAGADVRQGVTVKRLLREEGRVTGVEVEQPSPRKQPPSPIPHPPSLYHAPLVIGADGAYSVVAREVGMQQLDERHYCAGLRAYYTGVTGFHPLNHVELHFVDEAIPGYFWIFPMADGRANVGIGMLSRAIKRKDVRLKEVLAACIRHPRFRERFEGAEQIGPVRGWGLPLGSKPRPMAGDGWMLLGDAASLIDPFTGEGIGNAMISGELAAKWTSKAKTENDYTAAFLHGYERDVLDYLQGELRLSHAMQRLIGWKWLLNAVIRKASRSAELADAISCMFDDESQRRKLVSPLFYLRVLAA